MDDRSLGVAVDVTWSPVSGAAAYEVFRSDEATTELAEREFVGRTVEPRMTDFGYTLADDLHYWVRAVDSDGAAGELAGPVGLTTSNELQGSLEAASAWMRAQQEAAQGFRVVFDRAYDDDYRGLVAGTVEGAEALSGERQGLPYVAFDRDYATDYSGPVAGRWKNLDEVARYRVDVYSVSDAAYLQGSFAPRADGTWTSGNDIARGGEKVARLVRRSDDLVVATSGEPEARIGDVAVHVFSRTDADYLQQEVPLGSDGRFRTSVAVAPGRKIARLVNKRTGRTINSTEWADAQSYQGLVRSFVVPQDDPDYGYSPAGRAGYRLEQRSFVYDDALGVLAYLREGHELRAENVLAQLAALQNPDGSLDFSYDAYLGKVADPYRRSGAIAWVGYAAVHYARETGDDRFDTLTRRLADYLLSLQVTEANGYGPTDPRFGSVLGGRGTYNADYVFNDAPIQWVSTEHNVDAYFFLRDAADQLDEDRYAVAADAIRESLLTNHWQDEQDRFYQGVSPEGPDTGRALDLVSWGGLFLLAVGEQERARATARHLAEFRVSGLSVPLSSDPESYNMTYSAAGPISGYKPYAESPGYEQPPAVAWAEGTWGAILFRLRLGDDVSEDLRSMARMQAADPAGGSLQVTTGTRRLPWEFHAWPASAATAWQLLVLTDSGMLWSAPPTDVPVAEAGELLTASGVLGDKASAGPASSLVEIADAPADGFTMFESGNQVHVAPTVTGAGASEATEVGDGAVLYANTQPGADMALEPQPDGLSVVTQIRGAEAAGDYSWTPKLAAGDRLLATGDGSIVVEDAAGKQQLAVALAGATDAEGEAVPAELAVEDGRVALAVAHEGGHYAYPIHAETTWTAAAAMMPPPDEGPDYTCDERWSDGLITFDIDTYSAKKGPSVRWGFWMEETLIAALVAKGHVTARMSGKQWVQSSKTHKLVPQGGPSKRGVHLGYRLHSSIYRVHGVGYPYLRWGDYVQINLRIKSRGLKGTYYGRLTWGCEPERP